MQTLPHPAPSRSGDRSYGADRPEQNTPFNPFPKSVDGSLPPSFHSSLFTLHSSASNAWAVAGERSVSGKPLLAGDPHTRTGIPGTFWTCHLTAPGIDVAGAAVPGLPLLILGHNESIAWSVTIALVDTQDLFIERFDPANPTRYWHEGEWKEATVHEEVIQVRDAGPAVERVLETVHGPVISEALGESVPLAIRSTILDLHPQLPGAALNLCRAANWDQFRAALRDWASPPLHFIYADRDGHIGYQMAGAVPIRKQGYGVVPAPGDGDWDWIGWVDPDHLPSQRDPGDGIVVSANNAPEEEAKQSEAFLGFEWADAYRAHRIRDLLNRVPKHASRTFRRIQTDTFSAPMLALARALSVVRPGRAIEARAIDLLAEWDGVLAAESAAAAIVEVVRRRLLEGSAREAFGDAASARLGVGSHPAVPTNSYVFRNTLALEEQIARWQADGSWPERARRALGEACDELTNLLGPPSAWRWGALHRLTLRHPMGTVKSLGRLLNRGPIPLGGDTDTVFQTGLDPNLGYAAAAWLPAIRQIYDTGDWDRSRVVMPGGQSGNPFSSRYADQLPLWRAGRDHPLPFSQPAVEKAARSRITLRKIAGS